MPNGFYGTQQEWDHMEAPLRSLDPVLQDYALQHGHRIEVNYHNWPGRWLRWVDQEIERAIQIALHDAAEPTFSVGIVAWQDRPLARYWKHRELLRGAPIQDLQRNLLALLDQACTELSAWAEGDLEFAVTLRPRPGPRPGG
jgi:hypothetical protein